jgi:DNA-binding MarR family transcriptional regulator
VGPAGESLTYLLQQAAKRSLELLEMQLAPLELSGRQYLLLTLASREQRLSQQELASKLRVDPTVVVKLVDQLEERGLVERSRFADDRRQHRLTLTTRGKSVLAKAAVGEKRAEQEFTRAIGTRRNELRTLLATTLDRGTEWADPQG